MDTSKQAISASLVHFVNLFLAIITPNQNYSNPCIFYFLNLGLDTTVGVYIVYVFLAWINRGASAIGVTDITMGQYGTPPKIFPWLKQL